MVAANPSCRFPILLASLAVVAGFSTPGLAQTVPNALGAGSRGFIENRGQWDAAAAFRASFGPTSVWLTRDGWTVAVEERSGFSEGPRRSNASARVPSGRVRGVVVRMRFQGARGARLSGEERLEARHNWFLGSDPAAWVTDVPSWRRARLSDLYAGISAVAREEAGHFEYDLIVEPGADAALVVIECTGQDSMAIDEHGDLLLRTPHGDLRQTAPVAWEEDASGARSAIDCAWRILESDRVGFEVGTRDPNRRLVIDPGVIWSNLLGGTADEDPGLAAIAMSSNGDINVGGVVVSTTFPTTTGAYQTAFAGGWDAWAARFNAAGTMLWSTYLGGNDQESGRGLAIGPTGTVTLVGGTRSANFPVVSAFDTTFNGAPGSSWDAFLATLDPTLTGTAQLTWATFLGGGGDDRLNSVAIDAAGIVSAAGWTFSSNIPGIPPPNSYQPIFPGLQDGIIAQFNPAFAGAAQLRTFTFLGGTSYDYLGPIALGPGGTLVVHGATNSTNYPVVNAFQVAHAGGVWDTALSILDPSLPPAAQLVYSTYLGGSLNDSENGLAVDAGGRVTVGGWTNSATFPTTPGAFDTSHNGGFDAFVACIDPFAMPAAQLVYSTFVGGSVDEGVNDLVLDASGAVHAVGSVNSTNFPTTPGSYQPTFQGGAPTGYGPFDAFAFLLDPSGSSLFYATYLGGTFSYEFAYNVVGDACGNAIISGLTRSADFPATSGSYGGLDDVFLLKMDLLPTGTSRYGASTAGCAGPLEIGVTSVPMNGNAAFGVTCGGAPPLASGLLGISGGALTTPLVVSGLSVWINPVGALLFTASSNPLGYSIVPLPLPPLPALVGLTVYAQCAWADSCAAGGLSGSCALSLTIQ